MTARSLRPIGFVDGCRTPFQKAATGFVDMTSHRLAAAVTRGLVERTDLDPATVDRVVFGATVSSPRATNVAREAALEAGLPATVPAMTLTAAGASATAAIAHAADLIATGQADVVIAGGTDCISDPPIRFPRSMRRKLLRARRQRGLLNRLRLGLSFRPSDFVPDVPPIAELSTGQTMGGFTEQLAHRLNIARRDQDAYAMHSHQRAASARQHLAREIVPVETPDGVVEHDNGIRPDTSLDQLAHLPPAFAKDGTVTAGNASYLTDGASAVLMMSEAAARSASLDIGAWLRGRAFTAHDPADELLLGPVFATPRALDQANIAFDDIDVFEIHEAFAAQILAVRQLLASDDYAQQHLGRASAVGKLPDDRLNAWGGSLAIGNPFAPNGARLVTTAIQRLQVEQGRYALVTTCAGGALGDALVLERASSGID